MNMLSIKKVTCLSVYRDPFPLVIDENILEKTKIASPDNILAPTGFWEELSLVKHSGQEHITLYIAGPSS